MQKSKVVALVDISKMTPKEFNAYLDAVMAKAKLARLFAKK